MQKKRWLGLVLLLILGLALTALTYVKTTGYKNDVAVITDYKIKDKLLKKETDIYGNKDEERRQYLHVKVLSGKYKGKTYTVTNTYIPSQLVSQKYRARQRVFIQIYKGVLADFAEKRLGLGLNLDHDFWFAPSHCGPQILALGLLFGRQLDPFLHLDPVGRTSERERHRLDVLLS